MSSVTIVIPTRERCDTLVATLKSCVHQQYSDLSILVVDNFSSDDTASVISNQKDKRVRSVNTGKRLAMSANWEFALSHVETDYVIFLGDDDALLPHAVPEIMALVEQHPGIDAISWPSVEYGWPSCQASAIRNVLMFPLSQGLEHRSAKAILLDVIDFKRPYSELPFLYKGLIRMEAIRRLQNASGGKVFQSMIPDVYFGIAICSVIDQYFYSLRPFTVNGASGHSNGTATFASPKAKDAEIKFLSEDNIPFHPRLQFCPSIPVLVTESLMQARERLPELATYVPNLDEMVLAALAETRKALPNIFSDVKVALASIAAKNRLHPTTVAAIANAENFPPPEIENVYGINIFNRRCLLRAEDYLVVDSYSAALLSDSFLRLYDSKSLSIGSVIRTSIALLLRQLSKRSKLFRQTSAFLRGNAKLFLK